MEQSNTLLNKLLDHKDANTNIFSVPDLNRLFSNKLYPEFDDEFRNVTSDDVPHSDEEQPEEEPTHKPEMFGSYIDMEIGFPRDWMENYNMPRLSVL